MAAPGRRAHHRCMRMLAVAALALMGLACGKTSTGGTGTAPPDRFVGVTDDGGVVLARTRDGTVERRLMGAAPGEVTRRVELLDDATTLYVWTGALGHCGVLERTSVEGGSPVVVLEAVRAWSVSGDGTTLAYTDAPYVNVTPEGCDEARTVVVRDLASGDERRWVREQDPQELQAGVVDLAWIDAPRYLDWSSCGADSCGSRVLDTQRDGELGAASPPHAADDPSPVALSPDWFVSSSTVRPGAGTVVFSVDYSSTDGSEPYPIVEADALTKAPRRAVFDGPGQPLDFDATGTHLLFHRDRLFRWSHGDLVEIGAGFIDATW